MSEYDHLANDEPAEEEPRLEVSFEGTPLAEPAERLEQAVSAMPESKVEATAAGVEHRAEWDSLEGEEREQAIRDFYGYSKTEKRTQAERDAAAARMVANQARSHWQGRLPSDVAAVWTRTEEDERVARALLNAWGLDEFRSSSIHRAALRESEREGKMGPIRKAFIEAKRKEEKK